VEVEITASEPLQSVVLEARHRPPIPVFVLTPDGRALYEQLKSSSAHVPSRPRALVTTAPPGSPGNRLAEAAVSFLSPSSRIVGVQRPAPGSIGVLELLDAPPVYVSLLLGNVLLDVVEVNGQEERIVLRAASERVSEMLCEVRFRLVSATGPLASTRGYGLRLRGGRGTLIQTVTDAEGRGACRGVPPDAYELCVQVDGYAFRVEELELAPGERLDLGDLLLEPGVLIQGQVVDERGAGVDARVSFRRPANPEEELGSRSELASPTEHPGWFAVGDLPQGPLLCRVEGAEWAVNPRWITATGPVLEGLVVEALRGFEVTLVSLEPGVSERTRWTVAGERGDLVWSQTVAAPEVTVRLLPGRYVVERRGTDGGSTSRSLDVERAPQRLEL
jgi:hypothetical protein